MKVLILGGPRHGDVLDIANEQSVCLPVMTSHTTDWSADGPPEVQFETTTYTIQRMAFPSVRQTIRVAYETNDPREQQRLWDEFCYAMTCAYMGQEAMACLPNSVLR